MINTIYLFSALSALVISFFLTGFIRHFAIKKKILSKLRERDMHTRPVPRLGGIAIGTSLVIVLFAVGMLYPDVLQFISEDRLGIDRYLLGIILGSILITLVGVRDDLNDLTPGKQLFWQFVAAGIIIASGIGIDFIRSPWGLIYLNQWTWQLITIGSYTYSITLWSDLFTIVWLIVMMNVINWLDGLDGLAAGVTGIAAVMLFILSLIIGGNPATAILAIVLAGSIFGFLPWNFNPAKIFMGSAGSYLLGFILGVLAIVSGGKLATAILVLGLPVFDAIWVALRRIISGNSPFKGDRRHLHHRLVDAGFSVKQSVILIYLIAFVFGILALVDANAQAKLVLLIWVMAVLVILGATTFVLEKKNGKK